MPSAACRFKRVDSVEHVEQVFLGVDAGLLDAGQRLADDLLARRRVRVLRERFQVRDQIAIDEAEKVAELAGFQLLCALAPPGDAQSRQR